MDLGEVLGGINREGDQGGVPLGGQPVAEGVVPVAVPQEGAEVRGEERGGVAHPRGGGGLGEEVGELVVETVPGGGTAALGLVDVGGGGDTDFVALGAVQGEFGFVNQRGVGAVLGDDEKFVGEGGGVDGGRKVSVVL